MRIVALIVLLSLVFACTYGGAHTPERPTTVPQTAIWAGGPHGGDWFDCDAISGASHNRCTVYADVTGVVLESGQYRLREEKRAARPDELQFADYSIGEINLRNNKALVRVEPER